MSNYKGVVRTNYFRVRDEEKFRELMSRVVSDGSPIELWDDHKDTEGRLLFGFGSLDCLNFGLPNEDGECDDMSYDDFLAELSECIAENDAAIIFDAGHEKLRYIQAGAIIVTYDKGYEYVDIHDLALNKAREILADQNWDTDMSY